MSQIVVLGSSSFSGSNFISKAIQNGFKVKAIGRSNLSATPFNPKNEIINSKNFSFNHLDLNSDFLEISEICNDLNVEYIVNFAAQSMVGQSWEFPEDWYETNVVAISKIMRKIQNFTNIKKVIQFSTPEVYGSTNGWTKENFNFAPNTPYAVSRAASDWHLKAMHENFGFPVIFTRAANVYGEHQRLYRIVPRVILSALTGQKLPLQGGGKSVRSFIHIDDVSDALLKIINNGVAGESYHISTNELITIYSLVSLIAEKIGVKVEDLVEMAPDRSGKDFAYQLDSQKIRAELEWSDRITLSGGIDRTIKWVQENLDELKEMPLNYEHRR